MAYFGEWLARRRTELGFTLRELADTLGVPVQKLSRWERGYEELPYEVRDACWDAMKQDGELPPIDPAPFLVKRENPLAPAAFQSPRSRGGPKTWLEEWAERKGTRLEDVLKAFGMSASLKYHWRAGRTPGPVTRRKIARFLEIPDAVLLEHGWPAEGAEAPEGEAGPE